MPRLSPSFLMLFIFGLAAQCGDITRSAVRGSDGVARFLDPVLSLPAETPAVLATVSSVEARTNEAGVVTSWRVQMNILRMASRPDGNVPSGEGLLPTGQVIVFHLADSDITYRDLAGDEVRIKPRRLHGGEQLALVLKPARVLESGRMSDIIKVDGVFAPFSFEYWPAASR